MTDPGVVLGQQSGQTGEKHPAVSLALLLAQEEAGGGAEDHPGQVVDDDEREQELQSVRGPEVGQGMINISSKTTFVSLSPT